MHDTGQKLLSLAQNGCLERVPTCCDWKYSRRRYFNISFSRTSSLLRCTISSSPLEEFSAPSASSRRNGSPTDIAATIAIAYGKQSWRRLLTSIGEKRGDKGKRDIVRPRSVTVLPTTLGSACKAPRYVSILSACLSD